jgi:moderate conductance mechanosensitive channel
MEPIEWIGQTEGWARILLIISASVAAHGVVLLLRRAGEWIAASSVSNRLSKTRTVASLVTSAVVFVIYFSALGFVLATLGVNVTAYVASASIIGLAVGFGSQGLVQDVVTGLTVIFSDLFDVGDMIEIGGQAGIVRSVGLRFTVIVNSFGAEVYVPNRTIASVINYPRGYVRAIADVTLPADTATAERIEAAVKTIVTGTAEQFPGILMTPPSIEGRKTASTGKLYLRVKFRIWPGRGAPIESTFKQELLQTLKTIDPAYADWMIAVNYEVERRPIFRRQRPAQVK